MFMVYTEKRHLDVSIMRRDHKLFLRHDQLNDHSALLEWLDMQHQLQQPKKVKQIQTRREKPPCCLKYMSFFK